jgi:hypothetical protein
MSVDSRSNLVGKVILVSVLRFVIGTDHLTFICGGGCYVFFQTRKCFAFEHASQQAFVGNFFYFFFLIIFFMFVLYFVNSGFKG